MAEIKWIKLQVDIFDNRKIKQIRKLPDGASICLMWFQLMCLAGEINDYGNIYITKDIPFTEETLATEFDLPISIIKLGLQVFQQFGMIEIEENFLRLSSWERYQSVESRDKYREYQREYHRQYRAKQKALLQPPVVNEQEDDSKDLRKCLRKYDVNTQEERIKNKELEKEERIKNTHGKAVREVVDYLNQKTGKRYRADAKGTSKHIEARLNDGYSVDDLKQVIDNKCHEWKGTQMEQFLRPETLFAQSHMESYLNQGIVPKDNNQQRQQQQRPGNYFAQGPRSMSYDEWEATGTYED